MGWAPSGRSRRAASDGRLQRRARQVGLGQPLVGPEQVGDLREGALAHELPDGVAAIEQPSVGAIDEGKRGLPREDARETR